MDKPPSLRRKWQLAQEPQHRATPQRPRRDNLALRVDRVDLQNILRQIDANARDSFANSR